MNTDSPTPRDELEARVTALLLGQLTTAEEEALRLTMESDPELRRLHDRLRRTIGLVREAVASPGDIDRPPIEALTLSNERREALQANFKTIRPQELARREKRGVQRRELALVAAMILGLLVVAGPMFFLKRNWERADGSSPAGLASGPAVPMDGLQEHARLPVNSSSGDAEAEAKVASEPFRKRYAGDVALRTRRLAELGEVEVAETLHQDQPTPVASPTPAPDASGPVSNFGRGTVAGAAVVSVDNAGALGGTAGANWAALGMQAPENRGDLRFDVDRAVRSADLPETTPNTGVPAGLAELAKQESRPGDSAPALPTVASREAEGKLKAVDQLLSSAILSPTVQPAAPAKADGLASRKVPARTLLLDNVPETPPPTAPSANAEGVSDRQTVLAFGTEMESLSRVSPSPGLPAKPTVEVLKRVAQQAPLLTSENEPAKAERHDYFGNDGRLVTNAAFPVRSEMLWDSLHVALPPLQPGNGRLAANGTMDGAGLENQMSIVVGQKDQKAQAQSDNESFSAGARGGRFAEAREPQEQSRRQRAFHALAPVDPMTEAVGKELELRAKVRGDERQPAGVEADDSVVRQPLPNAPIPTPEVITADNPFSTFSLNVSDVSFKLAAASLENGRMPDPATVRTEEFINAFDYRDPEPLGGQPLAFHWERARYPFAHNRDLVRFSVKTAASGRSVGRPLNLVLLLDNSGSMERADRQRIRLECLRVLAAQLQPSDRVSVVAFARTARLWVDGLPGSQGGELVGRVGQLTPEGGTNLEEAMNLAYQTARRHFQPGGLNRVVLLTDGAANLGEVEPASLKRQVEDQRQQGVALDCFGLGWDGYNDDLLETLSRNGDGRYGFINTPEAAAVEFAGQLAGALRVAASDVKVQIQFNPRRVTAYRQMGYAKHQLTKQQFRDNTVDAAEIGGAEAGNALYLVEVNPGGEGPLGVARVRFKVPGTSEYRELEWSLAFEAPAKAFGQAPPALRLAGLAAAFSEWLVASPYAADVSPSRLLGYLGGVTSAYSIDARPKQFEAMLRQAGSLSGK